MVACTSGVCTVMLSSGSAGCRAASRNAFSTHISPDPWRPGSRPYRIRVTRMSRLPLLPIHSTECSSRSSLQSIVSRGLDSDSNISLCTGCHAGHECAGLGPAHLWRPSGHCLPRSQHLPRGCCCQQGYLPGPAQVQGGCAHALCCLCYASKQASGPAGASVPLAVRQLLLIEPVQGQAPSPSVSEHGPCDTCSQSDCQPRLISALHALNITQPGPQAARCAGLFICLTNTDTNDPRCCRQEGAPCAQRADHDVGCWSQRGSRLRPGHEPASLGIRVRHRHPGSGVCHASYSAGNHPGVRWSNRWAGWSAVQIVCAGISAT